MTPEEIVSTVKIQNDFILADTGVTDFTREKVLELMNVAAMQGFRYGSESALSIVKGKLYLKYLRESTAGAV
jgi:hypothetical protein